MIFQSRAADAIKATVASEAAIASNLTHSNVVATYGHDICGAAAGARGTNELDIYKFYLFQVSFRLGQTSGPGLYMAYAAEGRLYLALDPRWHARLSIVRNSSSMPSRSCSRASSIEWPKQAAAAVAVRSCTIVDRWSVCV